MEEHDKSPVRENKENKTAKELKIKRSYDISNVCTKKNDWGTNNLWPSSSHNLKKLSNNYDTLIQ